MKKKHQINLPETENNAGTDNDEIVVGLDIGSSKICAVVASRNPGNNTTVILGVGVSKSEGISRGAIINIDQATVAISNAINEAEQQSGYKVKEVIVGISGEHLQSFFSTGIIANQKRKITEQDVARVINESTNIKLPNDRVIIHKAPHYYKVDEFSNIVNPVGMIGVRIEVDVYIVTAARSAVETIYLCLVGLGIKVKDIFRKQCCSAFT